MAKRSATGFDRASRRRICVVTGTRADYGLLRWLMHEIRADRRLSLQIVATGSHLQPAFGHTVDAIVADGFQIDRRVDIAVAGDSAHAITKSTGLAVIGLGDAFADLCPDLIVLLGDRFEVLAAAQAALFARIPVAHLHGGELSEGALDDSMRHAITKLSHLHFVAAPAYRRRVLQLGESPNRVFCFGPVGADNFHRLPLLTARELGDVLELPIAPPTPVKSPAARGKPHVGATTPEPLFLITYHPATLGDVSPAMATEALLDALAGFPNAITLFTGSNADPGHAAIAPLIEAFVAQRPGRARLVASLGQQRYLSALRAAAVVIGNSSSGIIEAPFCGTPTVNLGDRQRGRLRAPSIIDCRESTAAITRAIRKALSPAFQKARKAPARTHATRDVSARIKDVLAAVDLSDLAQKRFRDLGPPKRLTQPRIRIRVRG